LLAAAANRAPATEAAAPWWSPLRDLPAYQRARERGLTLPRPTYLDINVYDAALDRVRFVYDECDDVIVAMSGGKDSTVVFHLACRVAKERGRLPIKVIWLDQEVEWQATADYMRTILYSRGVTPYWMQFPFRLTNSMSHTDGFLTCWDPAARDLWIREQDPISVRINPCAPQDRYAYISKHMHAHCDVAGKKHVGVLVGLRMVESPMRRMQFSVGGAAYKTIKWCHKTVYGNTRTFWPIYDFADQDVWTCIARNDLPYNRIYDAYFRYGVPRRDMRVSFLIHETSCKDLRMLQELEPETYDRFLRRVPGASTFGHLADDIMPKQLPPVFAGWLEYRDYLLENLVEPGNRATFRKLWRGQNSEKWYKEHVRGLVINDVDSTKLHLMEITEFPKRGTADAA
jgi:predicted phosphoadenosine phosphosulfate sulfurtransferase